MGTYVSLMPHHETVGSSVVLRTHACDFTRLSGRRCFWACRLEAPRDNNPFPGVIPADTPWSPRLHILLTGRIPGRTSSVGSLDRMTPFYGVLSHTLSRIPNQLTWPSPPPSEQTEPSASILLFRECFLWPRNPTCPGPGRTSHSQPGCPTHLGVWVLQTRTPGKLNVSLPLRKGKQGK